MARLSGEWRWFGPFLAITAIAFACAQALGFTTGTNVLDVTGRYALHIFAISPVVALAAFSVFTILCAFRREPSPVRAALTFIGSRFSSPAAAASAIAAVLLIPVLMGSYGTLKMLMPLSRSFSWDAALASVDRALFLGVDPWRITHAVFGAPLPTRVIDILYTLWVPGVMVGVLIASMAPRVERARYFLTFAAAWLLIGVVGAYVLASAGPCYAERLGTANAGWFAPLMERLTDERVGKLGAVHWQEVLWQSHAAQEYAFGRGISAAPSMHNAICMLYVLALAKAQPLFRVGARIFAAVILVGSVHLGWHYAIDGLLGWAAMAVIWKLAGMYLDWSGYGADETAGAGGEAGAPAEAEPLPI